jgi:tRNA splicing endonuclease
MAAYLYLTNFNYIVETGEIYGFEFMLYEKKDGIKVQHSIYAADIIY